MSFTNFTFGNIICIMVFLVGLYSTTLNILQGLNGLYCFNTVDTYTRFSDKAVKRIVTSGYGGADSEYSNYVNDVNRYCIDPDITDLSRRGSECRYNDKNNIMYCESSSLRTKFIYEVDCNMLTPAPYQSFDIVVNPNGISFPSGVDDKTINGTTVRAIYVRSSCLLNRAFYVRIISLFCGLSILSLLVFFYYSTSPTLKATFYNKVNWLDRYFVEKGFVTHCSPFSKSLLQNFLGSKCWRISECQNNYEPEGFLINSFDQINNMEHFDSNQNYSVIVEEGAVTFIHNDCQGFYKEKITNTRRAVLIYNYTLIKCNKNTIDFNGHYPNLREMMSISDSCKFFKGKMNVMDYIGGVSPSSIGIELGPNKVKFVVHFNKFWGFFDVEVFKNAMKGSRIKPRSEQYKNTEWKLYISDIYKHMGLRPQLQIKTFNKSKVLLEVESMDEERIKDDCEKLSCFDFIADENSIMFDEKRVVKASAAEGKQGKCNEKSPAQESLEECSEFLKNSILQDTYSSVKKKDYPIDIEGNELADLRYIIISAGEVIKSEELELIRKEAESSQENLTVLMNVKNDPNRKFTNSSMASLDRKIRLAKSKADEKGNCYNSLSRKKKAITDRLLSTEKDGILDKFITDSFKLKMKICPNFVPKTIRSAEPLDAPAVEVKKEEESEIKLSQEELTSIGKQILLPIERTVLALEGNKNKEDMEGYLKDFRDVNLAISMSIVSCRLNGSKPGFRNFYIQTEGVKKFPLVNRRGPVDTILSLYRRVINLGHKKKGRRMFQEWEGEGAGEEKRRKKRGKKDKEMLKRGTNEILKILKSRLKGEGVKGNKDSRMEGQLGNKSIKDPILDSVNYHFDSIYMNELSLLLCSCIYMKRFFIRTDESGNEYVDREEHLKKMQEIIGQIKDYSTREFMKMKVIDYFT